MSDDYSKATIELSNKIEEWAALEPYDPKRPKLVQVPAPLRSILHGSYCFAHVPSNRRQPGSQLHESSGCVTEAQC